MLATTLAISDGVLILEFSLCVVLSVALIGLMLGGLALERRGKLAPAVLVLAVGAVPIVVVAAVLLELQAHPIRWN